MLASPISAEIYQVRAATHQACDRVVFDLNGFGHLGYLVRYVPAAAADPSGRLRQLGIPVRFDDYGPGTHDWSCWRRELHRSMPILPHALQRPPPG